MRKKFEKVETIYIKKDDLPKIPRQNRKQYIVRKEQGVMTKNVQGKKSY